MLPGVWDLSFPTRDQTHTPCITRWIFNHRTTRDISSKEKRRACHLRTQWRKRIRIYSATWRNYFSPKRGTKCIYVFGDLTKHRQQWFLRKRKPTKWALPAQLPAWSEFPGLSTAVEGRAGSKEGGWSPSEKTVPLRSSRPPETSLGETGTSCTKAMWGAVFTQGDTYALGSSQSQEESQQKGAGRMQKGVSSVTGKTSPRIRLTRFYPAKLKKQALEGSSLLTLGKQNH